MRAYAAYLEQTANQFDRIKQYVGQHGCDKSGFTGLLALLQPGVDGVRWFYDKTLDFGRDRMRGAGTAVKTSADNYEKTDEKVAKDMDRLMSDVGEVGVK